MDEEISNTDTPFKLGVDWFVEGMTGWDRLGDPRFPRSLLEQA